MRTGGNGSKGPRAGHLVDALSSVPSTMPVGPPHLGFRVLGFYVCIKTPFPRAQELPYVITGQKNSEQGGLSENTFDSKMREAENTGVAQRSGSEI